MLRSKWTRVLAHVRSQIAPRSSANCPKLRLHHQIKLLLSIEDGGSQYRAGADSAQLVLTQFADYGADNAFRHAHV